MESGGSETGGAVSEDQKASSHNGTQEEKEKLMSEILELQNTLHDLSQRVHSVKEENEQLQIDNQVTLMLQRHSN